MGRVRTKTVKKAAKIIIEKYYTRLTLDFDTNKRICEEIAIIPTKPLRNKIAGGISIKLQEEERERRDNYVPEVSALEHDIIEVDPDTKEMLKSLEFNNINGLQLTQPATQDNVKVDSDLIAEDTSVTKNLDCSECAVKDQNWICLQCGVVSCGRYVSAHAKQHAETSGHQLCMSCDIYSVYCYKCDDYVSNDTEQQTIAKVRQSIMQIRKDENSDTNSNIGNEENSKDGSEGQNSCSSNSSLTQAPTTSSEPRVNDAANPENSTSETSDKRTRTNKNPEESVRSLRPRYRKRSHSDDSSSTENGTPKSKEKKSSPCNGKSQKEKKVVGLKNLGNTCFMNAVLQSLSNIQEFSCYFSRLPALEAKNMSRFVLAGSPAPAPAPAPSPASLYDLAAVIVHHGS
ncbi:hypothetical protein MSG28_012385, partial [Choristoneura fumiferana]